MVAQVDFYSQLSGLGDVIANKRKEDARKAAFSAINNPDGTVDFGKAILGLTQAGDIEGAARISQLKTAADDRVRQAERDKINDARADRQFSATQAYQNAQLDLSRRAANRADADAGKPILKEVAQPDGSTAIYRITRDGQATRVDTGAPSGTSASNPKSPFNQALFKADAERVNEYSSGAKLAEEGIATLDQIDSLRKDAFTAPLIGPIAAKFGHPATQALEASTNALSLDVAQKMKGSLSDKDIAFVKSQVPTAATGGAAGEAASGAIRAGFERSKQRGQFYRTWAEQNGNINGADAAWSRYVNDNPVTIDDKKALGGRRFNADYNKDFTPYLKRAVRVSSPEQARNLPSGTQIILPDGSPGVVP